MFGLMVYPGWMDSMIVKERYCVLGFPGGSDGKESAYNVGDPWFDPYVGKIPWRREWQPTPVFLPGESHGQRSLVGYSAWHQKDWVTNTHKPFIQLNSRSWWWTGRPGVLQFMGLQRVGHNWDWTDIIQKKVLSLND